MLIIGNVLRAPLPIFCRHWRQLNSLLHCASFLSLRTNAGSGPLGLKIARGCEALCSWVLMFLSSWLRGTWALMWPTFKAAAQVRNARVVSGHERLLRLAGMSIPVWRRTRLLLSSVFPHALHAAESTFVPRTTLQRLRSKGPPPWLTCLVGAYQCVDLEFVLVGRVRLFRQVAQELPLFFLRASWRLRSVQRPRPAAGRFSSEVWVEPAKSRFVRGGHGRLFHLYLSSLAHVVCLLLSSWTEYAAGQLKHRKYLGDLWPIDTYVSKQVSHLQPGERAVLRVQQTGAFYSGEFTKHLGLKDKVSVVFASNLATGCAGRSPALN